ELPLNSTAGARRCGLRGRSHEVSIITSIRYLVLSTSRKTKNLSRSHSSSRLTAVPGTPPTIAIVGRPNVGKSTLFNRLLGSPRAIVGDEPGITRDRLYGEAEWRGRTLRVVDTGGIIPDEKELIPSEIFRQAKVALEEAQAVILVIDARSELAAPDM